MNRAPRIFWIALAGLAAPYFIALSFFPRFEMPDVEELFWALKNSFWQAAGSSLLALFLAGFLLLGLLRMSPRLRAILSWFLLAPSFLPPLFLLIIFFSILDPFPLGLLGIILIQGFMNAGLIAVMLLRFFEGKLGGLLESAQIWGCSRRLFLRRNFSLIFPEIFSLSLFVFIVSWSSFSIPLVVGGGRGTTLEILIYEKIRIFGSWGQAVALSFLQLALILCFAFLPRANLVFERSRPVNLRYWGHSLGLIALAGYIGLFWLPLFANIPVSLSAIVSMSGLSEQIWQLCLPTLGLSFAVGFLCLFLFLLFSWGGPENQIPRLMRGWLAPSTSFLGLVFLFSSQEGSWIAYLMALVLVFFPILYRLGMDRTLENLRLQVEVSRTLGASRLLVWQKILIPQVWKMSCLLAGVGAFWSLGEFALGQIILAGPRTLALLSQSLLATYRVNASFGVSLFLLAGGFMVFSFFWGLTYVRR